MRCDTVLIAGRSERMIWYDVTRRVQLNDVIGWGWLDDMG